MILRTNSYKSSHTDILRYNSQKYTSPLTRPRFSLDYTYSPWLSCPPCLLISGVTRLGDLSLSGERRARGCLKEQLIAWNEVYIGDISTQPLRARGTRGGLVPSAFRAGGLSVAANSRTKRNVSLPSLLFPFWSLRGHGLCFSSGSAYTRLACERGEGAEQRRQQNEAEGGRGWKTRASSRWTERCRRTPREGGRCRGSARRRWKEAKEEEESRAEKPCARWRVEENQREWEDGVDGEKENRRRGWS